MSKKVIIMGAAGRDFHNFNVVYRDNPDYKVVCFTATQIPNIDDRKYPAELAGSLYPEGIPIYSEDDISKLIKEHNIDEVVFAYSDVSHNYVMNKASLAMAAGATFVLLGPEHTMIKSTKPVISICAVRTGSGKSQTTRSITDILKEAGKKTVVIRHPMPYGDLVKQAVQRFETVEDMDRHECTIEEKEEYEHHIKNGLIVYAGVDYEKILREAEKEADVILWDGGNNDFSFYKTDLYITIADPRRAGHEVTYHPGETNFRMADVIVINKVDSSSSEDIESVKGNIEDANPNAHVIETESPVTVDGELSSGSKVLVVEDGPTITHGGLGDGAGFVAAKNAGCELVDPRPYAVGSIKSAYEKYPHMETVLPALGYGKEQVADLEASINATPCDAVIAGTPIDLSAIIKTDKPMLRVTYSSKVKSGPSFEEILKPFIS